MSTKNITIFDTTLRDGEQSPGCSMYLAEKISLARQLERLGVDVIEAGFPFASEGDFRSVKAVARECRNVSVAEAPIDCNLNSGCPDRAQDGFVLRQTEARYRDELYSTI